MGVGLGVVLLAVGLILALALALVLALAVGDSVEGSTLFSSAGSLPEPGFLPSS